MSERKDTGDRGPETGDDRTTEPAPGDIALPKDIRSGGFRPWMLIPAIGAAMVLAVFLLGLQTNDGGRLPSALMDRPVPEVALPPLRQGQEGLTRADLTAPGVKVVNFWASWCPPCRAEHPQIEALAEDGIPVHGINYKDETGAALGFLADLGDPYTRIGTDRSGRHAIEWGVYGMPETFVVDGSGKIVHKHVGPIMPSDLEEIRAIIESARTAEQAAPAPTGE